MRSHDVSMAISAAGILAVIVGAVLAFQLGDTFGYFVMLAAIGVLVLNLIVSLVLLFFRMLAD